MPAKSMLSPALQLWRDILDRHGIRRLLKSDKRYKGIRKEYDSAKAVFGAGLLSDRLKEGIDSLAVKKLTRK